MAKKKRPVQKTVKIAAAAPVPTPPVVHGDCFRAFIDEARSIGNECMARREYDNDVVEYLKQKGLFEDWATWREAKRAPEY